ncbi:hypothetical protein [Necropsobacter rosorum]|uniref:hypothetical protein n=1 Tax=Necropsobacter rosorum TaxID=908285 RepID=UPI000690C4B4
MKKHLAKWACSVSVIIAIILTTYADNLRTSQTGLELIGNAEGCYRKPYLCPTDILTVGIGTTDYVEKIAPNTVDSHTTKEARN